ncbi:MAG: type II secretion system minor pseudopilin GspH [Magnetococcales bacterium]|nr:type II secretion system minor pseudopilin GspH [Magnetococcales bacterium]
MPAGSPLPSFLSSIGGGAARRARGFTLLELMVVLAIIAVMTSLVLMVRGAPNANKRVEEEGKKLRVLISALSDEAVLTGRDMGMQFFLGGYAFLALEDDGKWRYMSESPFGKRHFPARFRVRVTLEDRLVELPNEADREPKPQLVFGTTGETVPFKIDIEGVNGYRMVLSGNGRGGMQLQRPDKS